jgi:hypothetical protein
MIRLTDKASNQETNPLHDTLFPKHLVIEAVNKLPSFLELKG